MGYSWEIIGELEGETLGAASTKVINKYLSSNNVTALKINVRALEAGGTIPTVDNIADKMGTFNIIASSGIVGGNQVTVDFNHMPAFRTFLDPYNRSDIRQDVQGTQANDQYLWTTFYMPLSPDPYQPKFGFKDARIQLETTATETASDAHSIVVQALIHDRDPEFYLQCQNNSLTGSTGDAVPANGNIKLPQGGMLMGALIYATTDFQALTTTDAPTLRSCALLKNNTAYKRQRAECMLEPRGLYDVVTTATVTDPGYYFYDVGWRKGEGIFIEDNNTYLQIKTAAADALNVYPICAMPSVFKQ